MLEMILNEPIDYELLKDLYSEEEDLAKSWPGSKYPLCPEEWSRWIDSGQKVASLLFRFEGKYIGHVILRLNNQDQLFLCFVMLKKRYRNQGLIYKMLDEVEKFASHNFSQKEIYLHVDPNNYAALKVYQKHGYEKVALTQQGRFRMLKSI